MWVSKREWERLVNAVDRVEQLERSTRERLTNIEDASVVPMAGVFPNASCNALAPPMKYVPLRKVIAALIAKTGLTYTKEEIG